MSSSTRLKSTIYIGGLAPQVTESVLHDMFIPFGEIVQVILPPSEKNSSNSNNNVSGATTDFHRGFGYVEFEENEDAFHAIDNLDQSELMGRVIRVSPAKPQREQNEGLGGALAVWQQEGWLAQHAVSEEDKAARFDQFGKSKNSDSINA